MVDISHIKELALDLGFDICGVTRATMLHKNRDYFDQWIANGYGEPLEYMSRYYDIRFDSSKIMEGAKSVVVCGVSYKNEYSQHQKEPRIASYALSRDYHKTLRRMLKNLLRALQEHYPTLRGRCFTDSAPLLEKQLAVNAGLGWIGRQSLLINPKYGSFILLGEIVIDAEISHYDSPYEKGGCGSCRRCVEACPSSAINENHTIDTRRCISCRTVEIEDHSDVTLGGWVFGCDECQSCCPHNHSTPMHHNPEFDTIATPLSHQEWIE